MTFGCPFMNLRITADTQYAKIARGQQYNKSLKAFYSVPWFLFLLKKGYGLPSGH